MSEFFRAPETCVRLIVRSAAASLPYTGNCSGEMNLLQLVAVSLELFAEGLELAAARRVYVALPARQFRLGCEFRLRIGRRGADKSESRACE